MLTALNLEAPWGVPTMSRQKASVSRPVQDAISLCPTELSPATPTLDLFQITQPGETLGFVALSGEGEQ